MSNEPFQDVKVVINIATCPKFNPEVTKTKQVSEAGSYNIQYHRQPWKKTCNT